MFRDRFDDGCTIEAKNSCIIQEDINKFYLTELCQSPRHPRYSPSSIKMEENQSTILSNINILSVGEDSFSTNLSSRDSHFKRRNIRLRD